jgi:hypothetical protein
LLNCFIPTHWGNGHALEIGINYLCESEKPLEDSVQVLIYKKTQLDCQDQQDVAPQIRQIFLRDNLIEPDPEGRIYGKGDEDDIRNQKKRPPFERRSLEDIPDEFYNPLFHGINPYILNLIRFS